MMRMISIQPFFVTMKTVRYQDMEISGKTIELFGSGEGPLVILNTVNSEGSAVYGRVRSLASAPFTLAAISGLAWYDEMTPWPASGFASWAPPCKGLADDYLELLCHRIIPEIERTIGNKPSFTAIAGYSLAGLFALYSLFNTDIFIAAASASGSLWYPGFADYAASHQLSSKPARVYLSLGDTEASAGSRVMRSVGENTEKIHSLFLERGIDCFFEMNKGNHFRNTEERMAKGIAWIIASNR